MKQKKNVGEERRVLMRGIRRKSTLSEEGRKKGREF